MVNKFACRDCGNPLEPTDRGCTRCALNLEAERMIDRFVWRVLPIGLIAIVAVLIIVLVAVRYGVH